MYILRTAESATEGQSDKIADQISDAVVDAVLQKDIKGSVACETLISNGFCIVAGEMTTDSYVPIVEIAKNTIREIGYTDGAYGFDYRSAGVITAVNERTSDLSEGVMIDGKIGASDSSQVVGFACNETPEMIPFETSLARNLAEKLAEVRKSGLLPFLLPDGKTQVIVRFDGDKPVAIERIVISVQHARQTPLKQLREAVIEEVIKTTAPKELLSDCEMAVNPAGTFVIGGPQCDTGLTGRKSIDDCYGARVPHGGGALSGKDPMRIDRLGAYLARYLAKNIVATGAAKSAEVRLTYQIGAPEPIAVAVHTASDSGVDDQALSARIAKEIDLTSGTAAKRLELLKAQYRKIAVYGHFGRSGFGWEETDLASEIKRFI
ncbi:MAG: methionine adenosyltransferase [Helicobacteraceae bacterium]|jgi:S-adenosylmethionine synthetase|nr:methionine adenosyltransferase [Helicobacteraceae bacterium]